MQLPTKTRYAVRALAELASQYDMGPVPLAEIAARQGLSEKYLDFVMGPLRIMGFVQTQKGSKGGYILTVAPEKLTLYDVIKAVNGTIAPAPCVDKPESCSRLGNCRIHKAWLRVEQALERELQAITFADLT